LNKCSICDWFVDHINKESDKGKLSALKVSKKIHKKSSEHPTVNEVSRIE